MIRSRPVPWLALPTVVAAMSCSRAVPPAASPWPAAPRPPRAAERPHRIEAPAGTRVDEYFWLRDDDRSSPEVLAHLRAEEAYAQAVLAPGADLRERLYGELRGRVADDDVGVPVLDEGWWYYERYERGREHPIHCRRRASMEAPEEIVLDVNALAAGHAYYKIGDLEVAPGGRLVAWTEDTVGRLQHTIRIRDLDRGQDLPDRIDNVDRGLVWAADGATLLYVAKDPITLLGYRVMRHRAGTAAAADTLVREETDRAFYTYLQRSKSRRHLFIIHQSTVSTEAWYADAADPRLGFERLLARERDHLYYPDHVDGRLVILTNWQARNFRLVEAAGDAPGDRARWRDVIAHRDDAYLHGFEPFADFVAVSERSGGLRRVRVRFWAGGGDLVLGGDEPAFAAVLSPVPDPAGDRVRYRYSSPSTPWSTYEVDVRTGARTLLKRDPVPGGFDPAAYVTERLDAPARDGARVPVSLVYRKGLTRDGSAPLYLTAYGAYGFAIDPVFDRNRLSLLDRGFVVAIAHVRGGDDLGRAWYDDGRLLRKRNTFTDFIDVTEHLIERGIAARDQVFASGRSAGGLLMGVIANLRPDLYRGIAAHVPFVDIVTTMLDERLPLTSNEYDEWGDPRRPEHYANMLSYSPYDNVRAQPYPALLVTTALRDSQVQYFEPAKWVARLRRRTTGDAPVLLHIQMIGSHGGRAGRFERLREVALEYAFVLQALGRHASGS